MTAQVIEFAPAALRVRIKRACRSVKPVPLFKPATSASSCTGCGNPISVRQTLAIKRERGSISVYCKTCAREPEPQPEVLLSVGMSGEWDNCCQCHCEITPDQHCARDLLADLTWCLVCWPVR